MERLTERTAVGILVKEDYGEKVLRTLYSGYDGKPNPHYTNCEKGYCAMEKLAAYEDAEEQGLLLRLPCKVGDTVYSLDRFCGGYSSDCPSRPCKDCPDYKLEIHEEKFKLNNIYDFDKTVFLTQEKAEAKLKEMEG